MSETDTTTDYIITPDNFNICLAQGKNFELKFSRFSRNVEIALVGILYRLFAKYDILYMRDPVITIIKELITNAVKANVKRLYYQSKKLDINDVDEYKGGMVKFKEECLYADSPYFQQLSQSDYYVKINFTISSNDPEISIENNCSIRPEELQKIHKRIDKAYTYANITEAFGDVLDDSEGVGLGLIMALTVFKNSGYDKNDFHVVSEKGITRFSIRLSDNRGKRERCEQISREIHSILEYIPSFKENIQHLIQLCNQKDTTLKEISSFIKTDPGLASSILKQANSAGYLTSRRISSVEESVVIIGLAGIKTLAMAIGVDTITEEFFPKYQKIWEMSHKKAFYAYKIAIQEQNITISESAYIGALISDIGKVALMSSYSHLMELLTTLKGLKETSREDMLEEMTLGISHSTLSALITEKWHFDEELTQTIKYHTRPHLAPKGIRDTVETIYLAHILVEYEYNHIKFPSIDLEALKIFHITTEEELKEILNILQKAYQLNKQGIAKQKN